MFPSQMWFSYKCVQLLLGSPYFSMQLYYPPPHPIWAEEFGKFANCVSRINLAWLLWRKVHQSSVCFFNFAFTTREPFKSFSLRESDCASVVLAGLYRCAFLYIKKKERTPPATFLSSNPDRDIIASRVSLCPYYRAHAAVSSPHWAVCESRAAADGESALHDARLFFTDKLFTSFFATFTSG